MTRVQFYIDTDLDALQERANQFMVKAEKAGYRIINANVSSAYGGVYTVAIVYTSSPK